MRRAGWPARPWGTWTFAALCLLISVPAFFRPEIRQVLGGLEPLRSPWQRLVLPFQHGYGGLPGPIHLGLNLLLLFTVGVQAERLIGTARFALLSAAAAGAFALAHLSPGVEGHGSSGVIWAYAPILFVGMRAARRRHGEVAREEPRYRQAAALLRVMWVVVTLLMTLIPYLGGYRGSPLPALLLGNLFQLTATGVGFAFAWIWRARISAAWEGTGRPREGSR